MVSAPSAIRYRPEIDGLRAIAVVAVVLYHAGFTTFSGGFVGVDVFFVISGYLITSLIISDVSANKFSLSYFYERRIRRLLPALLIVCVTTAVFALCWMPPGQYERFNLSLLAVSAFASNFYFWLQAGYFAPSVKFEPLIHTWSLGVEEQFYLIFPPFIVAAVRTRKLSLSAVVGTIVVASLLVSVYGSVYHPSATFYLLPGRIWELGVGAMLALESADRPSHLPTPLSSFYAWIGLLALIFSILVFNEKLAFPGIYVLVPVAGAALIIKFAGRHEIVVDESSGVVPLC